MTRIPLAELAHGASSDSRSGHGAASIHPRMLVPGDALIRGQRIAHGVHRPHVDGKPVATHGEPVVLIHGTPSSSVIWRNVVPTLVVRGFVVHIFDLLGYGASERPWSREIDASVSGQVPILLELMDHWDLLDAHLIAHDIGGAVAQRLGVLHRDRLRSLVLLDACSFDSWPSERTRQQMSDGIDELILAPSDRHRAHFSDWLLSAVEDKEAMCAGPLDHYLDIISGPVGQASFFQHQVLLYDHSHTSGLTPRIHELGEVPVTLVWGEQDGWQKPHWAHKLHAAIPGSRLRFVADAGHFIMEDAPDQVANLLADHLDWAMQQNGD